MSDAMTTNDPLTRELGVYTARRDEWLASHLNQFVVIAGDEVEGFHPDYESAFKAGIRTFGLKKEFLIKQVCVTEPVYVVY